MIPVSLRAAGGSFRFTAVMFAVTLGAEHSAAAAQEPLVRGDVDRTSATAAMVRSILAGDDATPAWDALTETLAELSAPVAAVNSQDVSTVYGEGGDRWNGPLGEAWASVIGSVPSRSIAAVFIVMLALAAARKVASGRGRQVPPGRRGTATRLRRRRARPECRDALRLQARLRARRAA